MKYRLYIYAQDMWLPVDLSVMTSHEIDWLIHNCQKRGHTGLVWSV